MEKKDYFSLQSKYALVADCQERYRKELLDFIDKAFEMHGNEFEYKCDTHATWKEKNEDEEDEFDAMNDLPERVTIWVDDDGGHEVYPYCVRRHVNDAGDKVIEVDGWDWYDSDWVEHLRVYRGIDELQSVADFINAVLEQEQGGNLIADNSIENFKSTDNDLLHETIADIAFNMGWEHFDGIDSREMVRCIIQWAKEFEKAHEKTDWASKADYLEEIDEFSSNKISEYLLGYK